jgi:hypothetical protein
MLPLLLLFCALLDAETIEPFAAAFRLFAPIAHDWARLALDHPTWGVAKGGGVVLQLGPDEFLVASSDVRVRFAPAIANGGNMQLLNVEEGTFVDGARQMRRRWNGDQTDYGLNFTAAPVLPRVLLGTYR